MSESGQPEVESTCVKTRGPKEKVLRVDPPSFFESKPLDVDVTATNQSLDPRGYPIGITIEVSIETSTKTGRKCSGCDGMKA